MYSTHGYQVTPIFSSLNNPTRKTTIFHQGNLSRLPSAALMISEVIRHAVNQTGASDAPHLPKCPFTNHGQEVKVSGFGAEAHKTIKVKNDDNILRPLHHKSPSVHINPSLAQTVRKLYRTLIKTKQLLLRVDGRA